MIRVFDLANEGERLIRARDVETVYDRAGYTHIRTYQGCVYQVKESIAKVHKLVREASRNGVCR